MFTIKNNLGEYGLAPTAEECATLFGANRLSSYKNLPAIYYKIGEKFRKEIRTRGYLFRPRTFVMMDAYSFDKTEEDMQKTYELMHQVYLNIFKRLGIKIIPAVSDNGVIGGKVAEEFQAIINLGEDKILYDEEKNIAINKEVLEFENKDEYLKQLGVSDIDGLKEYSTVELENNFQLGTKYSDSIGINEVIANVSSKDNSLKIKELKHQGLKVMMVGDRINDAPSLSVADIGVSLNSAIDIAADSVDVILMRNDLNSIYHLLDISKKTLVDIKENLFWAFFYNFCMIPIACGLLEFVHLSMNPMIAGLAMTLSSFTVIINALRLKR